MKYLREAGIRSKKYRLPIFFPDATKAVIRSLDSDDLKNTGIRGIVVNTYHLMLQPGAKLISDLGGVKNYMGFNGLVVSDSGGFQLFSLLQRKKINGQISKDGIKFIHNNHGKKKKINFTPERCIQVQFKINADIFICLDYFTPPGAKTDEINASVKLTIEWAKRCKEEYLKQIEMRKIKDSKRPLLFGVIQGDRDKKAREKCAKDLRKIGFDGYGLGGWPFDKKGNFDVDIVKFTAMQTPDNKLRFALGIGNLQAIVGSFKAGYNIFDCVLPTRDARHKRLYIFKKDPEKADILNDKNIFGHIYIHKDKYTRDPRPISKFCNCLTCQNYSRAYLNHLFKIDDVSAFRLATLHNLRTYSKLMEILGKLYY